MRLKGFHLSLGSQLFKALGDESRIRILHLIIRNTEMCISDLEQILDFTQTKTSRHLLYLKNAGLVGNRRKNQWTFYFISPEMDDLVMELLAFMEKDPTLVKDQDHYKTMYSNRALAVNKIEQLRYRSNEL